MKGSNVMLTIRFEDPELEPEEWDKQAQWLMAELKEIDEVETVSRVIDTSPPLGNKSIGGFLAGLLITQFNVENFKRLISYLKDRLVGKPIELEVEADGRKLKLKAYSRQELDYALKAAQDFVLKTA
ncbi:hypothetical protein ACFS7Z_24345 [Pontibacter toksunensis]|uniref:Uncharacterized protein n=1 Tax=Pontibacter toksunensis TaxID=1332631 RepID=A0ABW6C0Y9_9BACT